MLCYSPVIDKLPMDERFSEDQSRDYFLDLVLGLEFCEHMFLVYEVLLDVYVV